MPKARYPAKSCNPDSPWVEGGETDFQSHPLAVLLAGKIYGCPRCGCRWDKQEHKRGQPYRLLTTTAFQEERRLLQMLRDARKGSK